MKTHLLLTGLVTVSVIASVMCAAAGDAKAAPTYQQNFKGIPAPEVPEKAAAIVAKATPAERKDVTIGVVTYAVTMNPASAPAIVGAVAKAAPDMATLAARTATRLQPKQAKAIARAAATAAPGKAVEIVEGIGRDYPTMRRELAMSVAEVAPKEQVKLTEISMEPTPVVLTSLPAETALPAFRGPSVQGPYIPLPGGVTNAPPTGGDVPAGGRDYARP